MSKINKSILKRFKITKNGKVLARKIGQNHFNAKQTGKNRRLKRKYQEIHPVNVKAILKLLKR